MIKRLWYSLLSNDKPQDKNVIWIDTSNSESFTLKLYRNGGWKPLQVVGTSRDMIERELTGYVTSHYHSYDRIINKPTTLEGYGITDCFNKKEVEKLLDNKVTKVDGMSLTSNNFSDKYKKMLDNLSTSYYNKKNVDNLLNEKQDVISDLESIREGAKKGNTALQSFTETDPIYLKDKPFIALKSDLLNDNNFVHKEGDEDIKGSKWFEHIRTDNFGIFQEDNHNHSVYIDYHYDESNYLPILHFGSEDDWLTILDNIADPVDNFHAANKNYVDTKISTTEENLVHKDGFERITGKKQFQNGIYVGKFNSLVANEDGVESGAWLDQEENPAPFIVANPSADDHAATKYYVDKGLVTKANIQHQHTVADITDFPEQYYDATAFFTSAYPSDKYEELLEAVKAKKTVYATLDEDGNISYVFFMSLANSDGSSSRVLLTTIFADGSYLYLNTFVLQQSGMTRLQENITSKANKATTLAGYGIGDAYTKSEVDVALAGKQSVLTAGNGISIEGNEIGVTTITESESQPNSSLWINPSEDTETNVTYNRSQIDAMVGAKQDALTLTVKDNGNIVLSNIQGQSKEFMSATPSGDPMHYAYEAAGAEYNDTGADIIKTTPWADLADDDADKTVVHKAGYWYLNGLGDITNEQMRVIFIETNNFMEDISQSAQARYCSLISRTHMNPPMYHITTSRLRVDYVDFVRSSKNLESIIFPVYKPSVDYCFRPKKITTAFSYCPNLKYIYGIINLYDCNEQTNAFYQSPNIRICQLNKLRLNLNINNLDSVSSKSILYMIQNEAATSAITITLHADAYARAMANADILAALEAHPNVSLASA